jgi:hypothetical protein
LNLIHLGNPRHGFRTSLDRSRCFHVRSHGPRRRCQRRSMVLLGRTRRLVAVGGMASHDDWFGEFIESVEYRDQQRPDATFASSSCPRVSTLTATPPQECPNRVVAVSKICKKAYGQFCRPRIPQEGISRKALLCRGLRPRLGRSMPSCLGL